VPGLLIALGVTLVTAGMFTYTSPVEQGPVLDQPPVMVSLATPTPEVTEVPYLTGEESFAPSTPLPVALPAGWPTGPSTRVATRVVVRELSIDIPVIEPGNEDYPLCGVSMYLPRLGQPGGVHSVYIYAHARFGMFLPILDASKIRNGQKMLGMIADVYTSDDLVFRYEIIQVRRHQVTLSDAFTATSEVLWLQTSEGPRGTVGKTQVVARPSSIGPANPGEAHPKPRPVVCD
jgi:hypothetical protein